MSLRRFAGIAFACAAAAALAQPMHHAGRMAAGNRQAAIREALSAAPPAVAHARVMDMSGHVLREGNNGFTCMPFAGRHPGRAARAIGLGYSRLAAMLAYAHHDRASTRSGSASPHMFARRYRDEQHQSL